MYYTSFKSAPGKCLFFPSLKRRETQFFTFFLCPSQKQFCQYWLFEGLTFFLLQFIYFYFSFSRTFFEVIERNSWVIVIKMVKSQNNGEPVIDSCLDIRMYRYCIGAHHPVPMYIPVWVWRDLMIILTHLKQFHCWGSPYQRNGCHFQPTFSSPHGFIQIIICCCCCLLTILARIQAVWQRNRKLQGHQPTYIRFGIQCQCCGSKYIEFGSGSRTSAQFGSGSRTSAQFGSESRVTVCYQVWHFFL